MSTELDHLRSFRAQDGAPDPDARAAARAALLERIEAPAPAPVAPARRSPRRRLRATLGGIVVAGAAAGVIALATGLGSGGVQPAPATAAQVLRETAAVAAQQSYAPVGAGQWWYARTEDVGQFAGGGAGRPHYRVELTSTREEWTADGRAGRTRTVVGTEPRFPTESLRDAWIANGRPHLGEVRDSVVAPSKTSDDLVRGTLVSPAVLQALPTDADALHARIEAAAREATAGGGALGQEREVMFNVVLRLLSEGLAPTPPDLRAALYRVLARIPGVELRGEGTDARGRIGTVVALELRQRRFELVIDPATARLLELRTILLEDVWDETPDGRRIPGSRVPAGNGSRTTYLASGVVDSTEARP